MEIVHPLAQAYAERYSSPENELLRGIADYTTLNRPDAQMLSGHLQGRFLEMISCILRPRRILEIGTYMGYSALCLAGGLDEEGQLHTIELGEPTAALAAENFRRAGQQRIILHIGNALEIIPSLHEAWDLVFIDADKAGYCDYYRMVLPRLSPRGLILADNVLFHGEVLEKDIQDKNAKAIQAFNDMVRADETVEKVMVTLRDGLMLIRKK